MVWGGGHFTPPPSLHLHDPPLWQQQNLHDPPPKKRPKML